MWSVEVNLDTHIYRADVVTIEAHDRLAARLDLHSVLRPKPSDNLDAICIRHGGGVCSARRRANLIDSHAGDDSGAALRVAGLGRHSNEGWEVFAVVWWTVEGRKSDSKALQICF